MTTEQLIEKIEEEIERISKGHRYSDGTLNDFSKGLISGLRVATAFYKYKSHCPGCQTANGSSIYHGGEYTCYCDLVEKNKSGHFQKCPSCKNDLKTQLNYPGAGSHYWSLLCPNCGKKYSYSTYNWKLVESI